MCAVTLRLSITASDDVRKTVPRAHRAGATCASSHLARVPCARAGPRLTPARASRFRDLERTTKRKKKIDDWEVRSML